MGKSSRSSTPQPPDPVATANAQSTANIDTAKAQATLNQVNEITPWGSSIYSPTGQTINGIDQMQRVTTLSPEQQAINDAQTQLTQQALGYAGPAMERVNQAISQPIDFSGLGPAPVADDATRQRVEQAMYDRARAYLDPYWNNQQKQLDTRLIQAGIPLGNGAYSNAMGDFARQRGQQYNDAMFRAIEGGGAEQSRLFGLDSAARERAIQEMMLQRTQPINEWAALLGQSGGVNLPQFSAVPQTGVANTDLITPTYASYNALYDQYNDQQNRNNSLFGSLATLGGTLGGAWITAASDERVKEDIKPVSDRVADDLPMYTYKYKGGNGQTETGPMAQDLEKIFPGSVQEIAGGIKTISPTGFFGLPLAAVADLTKRVQKLEARA